MKDPVNGPFTLELRRQLPVAPARAFAAWTDPAELLEWWGPKGVRCIAADIDLRVGGTYRIVNELPDQSVLCIEGIFEVVTAPTRLQYTWSTDRDGDAAERVDVRFIGNENGTEIVVRHSRIPDQSLVEDHRFGWQGCLDGLATHLQPSSR